MIEGQIALHPKAAETMAVWRRLVADKDLGGLPALVRPDAVFRSPMAHTAYTPAAALVMALQTVITVFEDFTYHRDFVGDEGRSVVLEFSARIGDKRLKGIDIIRFDDDGLIAEFEVMIRPMSGLKALGEAMGARLGDKLPAFKAGA